MIRIPSFNPLYETSNKVEYPSHGIIDVAERFHEIPTYELLARPIRALHPRMRPVSPDYNVDPRVTRCDPGLGPGFGVNKPDVTKIQPPKDIVNRAPPSKIGPHPQTGKRYPNNFLSRLYEDDGKPAKYEYGYEPRSQRDMVDILAHHRGLSTTTRDMTEEGKLPIRPRPELTTTRELDTDRAGDHWKRFYPKPAHWQRCGLKWDRAQVRPILGLPRDLTEPRALGQDRLMDAREHPEMKPEFQMIRDLVKEDLLPHAFEKPVQNFSGYVPRLCVEATLEPRRPQPDKYLTVARQFYHPIPGCEFQPPLFPRDGRFTRSIEIKDPICPSKRSRTEPVEPPSNFYKYF